MEKILLKSLEKNEEIFKGLFNDCADVQFRRIEVGDVYKLKMTFVYIDGLVNKEYIADAILIRAGEPLKGVDIMLKRTAKAKLDFTLTRGPGNLGKALGISKSQSGKFINENEISIYDDGIPINEDSIGKSKRIGVNYAGEDALLEYRYFIRNNPFVSGKPTK